MIAVNSILSITIGIKGQVEFQTSAKLLEIDF